MLIHALDNKENTTKFKLIYSNVSEKDILLRAELDALKAQNPETFEIVYLVDQPSEGWTAPTGYITASHIKENIGGPSSNIKIFICGVVSMSLETNCRRLNKLSYHRPSCPSYLPRWCERRPSPRHLLWNPQGARILRKPGKHLFKL